MNENQLKNKFSKHIGRILTNIENTETSNNLNLINLKDYVRGELWLLCEDLLLMINIKESNYEQSEKNFNK